MAETEKKKTQREIKKAESESKKIQREINKQAKELARAQKIAEKERMARLNAERKLYAALGKRNHLPFEMPDFGASPQDALVAPPSFEDVSSLEMYEIFSQAIQSGKTIDDILNRIAVGVMCRKFDICIIQNRTILRAGKKISVVCMRYAFNPAVNLFLKNECAAKFDQHTKAWNVDHDYINEVERCVSAHFRYIFDMKSGIAFSNKSTPEQASVYYGIRVLPVTRTVSAERVLASIDDDFFGSYLDDSSRLAVHDVNTFIPVDKQGAIATKLERMLFRISAKGKNCIYFTYCTTRNKAMDRISGGGREGSASIIARYIDGAIDAIVNPADHIHNYEP